jgi:hypothetical protein
VQAEPEAQVGILYQGGSVDDLQLANQVKTTYIGDHRVHIAAADRGFEADQRTHLDRSGAGFCPLELVAAALGA